jgi:hypothetical protein
MVVLVAVAAVSATFGLEAGLHLYKIRSAHGHCNTRGMHCSAGLHAFCLLAWFARTAEGAFASALRACVDVPRRHDSFWIGRYGWLEITAAAGAQMFGLRLEPSEDSVVSVHFRDLHCLAFPASHHDRAARLESRDLVLGIHGLQQFRSVPCVATCRFKCESERKYAAG